MKRLAMFLIMLFSLGYVALASAAPPPPPPSGGVPYEILVEGQLYETPDAPRRSFNVTETGVIVYEEGNQEGVQVLQMRERLPKDKLDNVTGGSLIGDFNFDGYPDICIFLNDGQQIDCYFWLWDPEAKMFSECFVLEEVVRNSPYKFLPYSKSIIKFVKNAEGQTYMKVYTWNGKNLVYRGEKLMPPHFVGN